MTASSGVLNLEVPGVYEIRGDGQREGTGHEVTAELRTDDGEELTVEVDPDGSTQRHRVAVRKWPRRRRLDRHRHRLTRVPGHAAGPGP
ncbi:hypothetical protein E1267_43440 [Nonomuraea longispora]|uniref:Uncharacterized protein n=1 Tax=Nonomuraea longispora TaxID=1848320 RepID=A0A4V2XH64_9ACTN|nr:hypothetical protein [Nonomuraea longispora]TDB93415.1 hypothetical protein E1267_43440 [Nonomuraea longispora]